MAPERLAILKLHKSWADRTTLFWQMFVLLLFGGIYILLDQAGIAALDRTGTLLILAVMVLIAAIWQAIGLGIARIHMVLRDVDLETGHSPPNDGNSN